MTTKERSGEDIANKTVNAFGLVRMVFTSISTSLSLYKCVVNFFLDPSICERYGTEGVVVVPVILHFPTT